MLDWLEIYTWEDFATLLDCKETAEDDGDYNYPSFKEWLGMEQ